jgi:hypothetical protein
MKASVLPGFMAITPKLEGDTNWMYLDVKGLVTTGWGDLIDPINAALYLPWFHKMTGLPASVPEIRDAWAKVKGAISMMRMGGGAYAALTDLRLTSDGLSSLVQGRLGSDDELLSKRWSMYANAPADGQLALLLCAWAAGPAWPAPHLDAALASGDWDAAAGPVGDANAFVACRGHAWLNDDGNPGLRPRNLAVKLLLENAACVASLPAVYDPNILYWPTRLGWNGPLTGATGPV